MLSEKLKAKFGDLIENGWASETNPTRTGYFVREFRRPHGRMNAGLTWEITDGKGKFWELSPTGDHKITVTPRHQAQEEAKAVSVEGWKLVPVEPTEKMLNAACDVGPDMNAGEFSWDNAKGIWSAMMAATPQPPNQIEEASQQGSGQRACGSRDDQAVGATAALAKELDLIRQMAAEGVKWDQECLDAIPKDYVGPGFTVGQYWRDRLSISKSWQAFCADPINHPDAAKRIAKEALRDKS